MAMVVTQPCFGCKDKSCVPVCPAECFYEDTNMLYIDPNACIDCEACVVECPVDAIFHEDDVPKEWHSYISLNKEKASQCPPATEKLGPSSSSVPGEH